MDLSGYAWAEVWKVARFTLFACTWCRFLQTFRSIFLQSPHVPSFWSLLQGGKVPTFGLWFLRIPTWKTPTSLASMSSNTLLDFTLVSRCPSIDTNSIQFFHTASIYPRTPQAGSWDSWCEKTRVRMPETDIYVLWFCSNTSHDIII